MLKKLIVTAALTLGSTMVKAQDTAWYGGMIALCQPGTRLIAKSLMRYMCRYANHIR